jgi:acetyltransferase-like isoleucine patch superfamily enzyme
MKSKLKNIIFLLLKKTEIGKALYYSQFSQNMITFRIYFIQKILGFNKNCYWPVHHSSTVQCPQNILIGIDTAPGIMNSCYIQGYGGIIIGDYTQVGPGVGIISKNHDPKNIYEYNSEKFPSIKIGSYCWLGMNSIILPGVELGDFTIVGAGSIVTKSVKEGYCIIAGNPARVIKKLNKDECVKFKLDVEYHGYISNINFTNFRNKYLNI